MLKVEEIMADEIAIEQTTIQQVAGQHPAEAFRIAEALGAAGFQVDVLGVTAGSSEHIVRTFRIGRASMYLGALSAAVLGELEFDGDSTEAISEGRATR